MTMPAAIDIAHLVQMAVAPVFLLTGVGAILSVLTTRLSRAIDRGRQIDAWIEQGRNGTYHAIEVDILHRRCRHINFAITLCTMSAFFVCSVVFTIFISLLFEDYAAYGHVLASLFILAMICLIGALLLFLKEIWLANKVLFFSPPHSAVTKK